MRVRESLRPRRSPNVVKAYRSTQLVRRSEQEKKDWLRPIGEIPPSYLLPEKWPKLSAGAKESSDSDKGDRIESIFNISFWAKEGAIDWKWLGFDTSEKEHSADALALALERECFRVSERDVIDCLLDSPRPCAIAVLRTLQMCEPNDLSEQQMPEIRPWCGAFGSSLYTQIWNYACHMTTPKTCVCTYTGVLNAERQ